MTQLVLDMPEEAFATMRTSPSEFVSEMRVAAAVKWYEIAQVSQGPCGMPNNRPIQIQHSFKRA